MKLLEVLDSRTIHVDSQKASPSCTVAKFLNGKTLASGNQCKHTAGGKTKREHLEVKPIGPPVSTKHCFSYGCFFMMM